MALTVENLSCTRSGRRVLDRLSLRVDSGETLVVRGPNGAGKSTLLRTLAGLLPAQDARIALDDVALRDDPDGYGALLAFCGHLDGIKPQLSVSENLTFWAALYEGNGVPHALQTFGLAGIADRPAHACSAGQKRRLGLARLLVAQRRLWLLDEPTVSLDAEATATLLRIVAAHVEAGGLAIIVTHFPLDGLPHRDLRLDAPAAKSGAATGAIDDSDPFLGSGWT